MPKIPAIRAIQQGREFYTTMITMREVAAKCVSPDAGYTDLPLEHRRQRALSSLRLARLYRYLRNAALNNTPYVLPAITCLVDCRLTFHPGNVSQVGFLEFTDSASWFLADGQHRAEAIRRLLRDSRLRAVGKRRLSTKEQWNLEDFLEHSMPVTIFCDVGTKAAQQMFVDLNRNVSKPSRELLIAFDHREG